MAISVRGDIGNLRVLANQLSAEYGDQVVVTLTEKPSDPDDLRHGILAEVIVAVVVNLGSSGLYDGIRALISRAAARGPVEVDGGLPGDDDGAPQGR
jgi:hypothetical protein